MILALSDKPLAGVLQDKLRAFNLRLHHQGRKNYNTSERSV